jgi:addiction module RelE/StbE family toxin
MLEPGLGKPLSGDFKGFYSLKVWPLRIIYQIDMKNNVIYVTRIGQREGVYR